MPIRNTLQAKLNIPSLQAIYFSEQTGSRPNIPYLRWNKDLENPVFNVRVVVTHFAVQFTSNYYPMRLPYNLHELRNFSTAHNFDTRLLKMNTETLKKVVEYLDDIENRFFDE